MNDMRKLIEAVETVEEGRYAENIPTYIKNEANDLAIAITELEAVAEFAREEGSDATAGSIDSAIVLISQAIRALKRAEKEVGTNLDRLGHDNALGHDHEADFGGWPDDQR